MDNETLKMYDEAIELVEKWRLGNGRFKFVDATPNQIHLYNIFSQAKSHLSGHRGTIEDTLGIYMKRGKKK